MNWPNRLTLSRLALTAPFVAALSLDFPLHQTLAFALFLVAGLTDYVDGLLARRLGASTNFGRLMDPVADKVMMSAAFVCLVPAGAIPAWAAIVIISREFLITGLRLLAGAQGAVLSAEALGKHKTAWQIVTVVFFLVLLALPEWPGAARALGFPVWQAAAWKYGGGGLVALSVALTLLSGAGYLWKHRDLIADR